MTTGKERQANTAETEENGRKPRPRPRSARLRPYDIIQSLLADGWRFAYGGDNLYVYEHGVYVPGARIVRNHLFQRLGTRWGMVQVNSVIQGLKDISPELWPVPTRDYINLANGLYNQQTQKLEPHSADHLTHVQLPIIYDPSATCPSLDSFLEDISAPGSAITTYEILGWLATTDTWLKRAILLVGPKNSGKSTFCELIYYYLGGQNISGVPLQQLTATGFARAELFGKLANVFPDLPNARVEESSIFKTLTGNDPSLTADRKYGQPFSFKPFVRLLFSANEIPQSADQTDAYLDRWLVNLFPNTFELNDSYLESMATHEEISGLFNSAMAAYNKVLKQGNFTLTEATQAGATLFKEAVVPVIAFLAECCDTEHPNYNCDRTDLYHAFCGWCSQTGRRRPSNRRFYEQLRQHFPEGTEKKTNTNWVWTHLTLNDTGQQALEHFQRRERV
jgi:putative DNA primase/helicase